MKKEVEMWIENDIPKGIIYENKFYFLNVLEKQMLTRIVKPKVSKDFKVKPISIKKDISKGKFLKKIKSTLIYENPANDIKYFIDNGMSRAGLEEILKKYYPNIKISSIKKYMVGYLSYLKSTGVDTTHLTRGGSYYKKHRKRRKAPSPDCIGFSKTYKTWIKDFELKEVQRLINMYKYGYKPTVKNMIKESYLTKPERIRATLNYLQQEGKVIREPNNNTYTYKMI